MHQIGAVRPGAVCPSAPDERPVAATEEKDGYTTIISQLEEADLQEGGGWSRLETSNGWSTNLAYQQLCPFHRLTFSAAMTISTSVKPTAKKSSCLYLGEVL